MTWTKISNLVRACLERHVLGYIGNTMESLTGDQVIYKGRCLLACLKEEAVYHFKEIIFRQ